MGFINDKLDTTNSISQFEILSSLPTSRITSSIASVNSKDKNLLPFLLDMINLSTKDETPNTPSFGGNTNSGGGLATLGNNVGLTGGVKSGGGGNKMKTLLLEILIKFLPSLGRIVKEGIIKAIKTSFSCNSTTKIPTTLPSVIIDVDTINLSGMLKVEPNSISGVLTYGNDPSTDMNLFIRNLLQTPNTMSTWGDGLLDLMFDDITNKLTVTMGSKYGGKLFDTFLADFMNSISVIGTGSGDIGDKVSFMMNQVMENLFGTISSNTDISIDTLGSLEETNMMMEKVFSSDPYVENFIIDNSFFSFSNEDLKTINDKAKHRYQGYNTVDMGCGVAKTTISVESLIQINNIIKGSTPTEVNNIIEQSIEAMSEIVTSDVSSENKENVKVGFFTKFITEIPKVLTGVIFTPKILVLYQIVNKLFKNKPFGNDPVDVVNTNVLPDYKSTDFVFDNRVFFNYVARESLSVIYKILFDILKRTVLKLVSKLGIKLIKERAELKLKSILSITYGITDGLLASIPTP